MAFRVISKSCAGCGVTFTCGPDHESGHCWCDRFPPILPPTPGLECLCPPCLATTLRPQVEQYIAAVPRERRVHNPLFTAHHRPGVFIEGLDYYRERGLMVFTAWHHLKRGECCGNGCRHCPY